MDSSTIPEALTNHQIQNSTPHHKKPQQEDPFPLITESQTPLTDISSTDSDSPSTKDKSTSGSTSRARAKKARKATHTTQPTVPALRPAKDILSRIRHDPDLEGESKYVVGYVDRHAREPMEMDVRAWKGGVSDVTDEDFIPQHRILYFRRKGDVEGRKVWDRARRLDRVFGSGVLEQVEAVEEDDGGEGVVELQRKAEETVLSDEVAQFGQSDERGITTR